MFASKEKGPINELFCTLFCKHWPVWVGGILLGALNILIFAIKSPLGASGGLNAWGESIYGFFSSKGGDGASLFQSNYGMLVLFILIGAMVGAFFSREFALRIPPKGELLKGAIGGVLMALGATIGIGCSIGSFFSGVPALSSGALVFTVGMIVGVIISMKYLLWEMENKPNWSSGKSFTFLAVKPDSGRWQIVAGIVIVLLVTVLVLGISPVNPFLAWFIIIGTLMGFISQRSRFCIVRSFRDPLMTGESAGSVGVIAGLMVSLVGIVAIKYFGITATVGGEISLRAREMTWVFPNFWGRALLGGLLFGLGMTVAGGCAVGTLWRMGEGQVKLWFAGIAFILVSPVSNKYLVPWIDKVMPQSAKMKSYLPDYLGYDGAFFLVLGLLLLWYVFVKWNEKTGKFSAF